MKISKITAYEIIASGGYPSVEVEVTMENGMSARASVPYGASAGSLEASVLIDQDQKRYHGQGMLLAAKNINEIIAPQIIGKEVADQVAIDKLMIELDGTEQKTKLGGNAILAVSLAVARAGAKSTNMPLYRYISHLYGLKSGFEKLPQPMAVAIEGGKHADQSTDLQEYSLVATGDFSVSEGLRAVLETYHQLKQIIKAKNLSTNVGNEGAFAPSGITYNQTPLELLDQAIEQSGYHAKTEVGIAIDAAASEFYEEGEYQLELEGKVMSGDDLINYYRPWLDNFPIVSVEDMFAENDWPSWQKFNQIIDQYQILHIGDDLTVTNIKRVKLAIENKAINSLLVKLNQIGSLTETIQTCSLAKNHGLVLVPSHRGGGETNDTFMVDLAVAVGARYIKVGPTRGERVSKYNRLLAIEREIGLH